MNETIASLNAADAVVLAVIVLGIAIGAYRGLLVSIIKMFSSVVSLVFTGAVTRAVSAVIRKTFIYSLVFNSVADRLGISSANTASKADQYKLIQGLDVPDFLKTFLNENNNNVVYEMLGADTVNEYITGYIANLITNVIIFLCVFLLVFVIISMLMHAARLLCKIPVIKQCNAIGGGIVGMISAFIVIWIGFAVLHIFVLKPEFEFILSTINSSAVAGWFYNNNVIINLLFKNI